MAFIYDNKDFNDYLIGNLYIEAKNKEEAKESKFVKIHDSVTSIGGSAFYSCLSLTSITIPNSVTYISSSAFESCTSLTSVTIPNSVTSIAEDAFYDCSSLKSITISRNFKDKLENIFTDIDLSKVSITFT
jgi:hypothetical protein